MIERLDGLNPNSPYISMGGGNTSPSAPSEQEVLFQKTSGRSIDGQTTSDRFQLSTENEIRQMEKAVEEQKEKSIQEDLPLEKTIGRLNDRMNLLNRQLMFRLDERIGRNYVSIIDKETKETIKEFPPEEIRNFIAQMMEFEKRMQAGGESDQMGELVVNIEV